MAIYVFTTYVMVYFYKKAAALKLYHDYDYDYD